MYGRVDVPLPLELEVVPDSAPRVELVSPAADTLVAGDDRIPLRITVTDDHGIAAIELQSWKQGRTGGGQPPLAQRLSAEAKPGQILVSQRVFGAIETAIESEDVGDLVLKGYSRPVAAYNVVALRVLARPAVD